MSKLFSTLIFFLFLLFQTASLAEEETNPQTNIEEPEAQEHASQDKEEDAAKKELSKAQKEAQEAEEAELREAGMEEEPPLD